MRHYIPVLLVLFGASVVGALWLRGEGGPTAASSADPQATIAGLRTEVALLEGRIAAPSPSPTDDVAAQGTPAAPVSADYTHVDGDHRFRVEVLGQAVAARLRWGPSAAEAATAARGRLRLIRLRVTNLGPSADAFPFADLGITSSQGGRWPPSAIVYPHGGAVGTDEGLLPADPTEVYVVFDVSTRAKGLSLLLRNAADGTDDTIAALP